MTATLSRQLNGILTEISIQNFADAVFVLVTQVGKVGNLIQVSLPATIPLQPAPPPDPLYPDVLSLPPPPIAIQLTPLLGHASSEHIQTLHNLYASQIATITWTTEAALPLQMSRKNVIVGIALRKTTPAAEKPELSEEERSTFAGIMSMIQEMLGNKVHAFT
ncbi:hypothetical protein K435DRAFT_917182 [Dendrothele bispora CBS 962.96]|uniref:Proteasome assembly chaperone 3 n=1 Tax=Dendrothele bispora (strain CBS 962.96) TaxID=1314807 RepID=A0A4S8LFK4_DENBC|nr:hypothetical protein K435DRAFT_821964 [Dendrothele bispora CBS 962.96]THU88422.1 hypothetical protein K435DRAFT_917182 [Dendrothele bispora CBS 962.96]